MTLQEKLDEKLPIRLSHKVWQELEQLFDEVETTDLEPGFTISVFKNDIGNKFCYLKKSSKSRVGISFSCDFDFDTLKEVIKIAEKNGLKVETCIPGSSYDFIYLPTWLK